MEEIWKPIPEYEGKYEVSNAGRVRSLDRSVWCHGQTKAGYFSHKKGRELRPGLASTGYPCVVLWRGNTQKVHVLVALAFLGPCPVGCEVRHIDGSRDNPRADNLQYGTRKENIEDSKLHGTFQARYEASRKLKKPMRELVCRLYGTGAFKQCYLSVLFNVKEHIIRGALECGL